MCRCVFLVLRHPHSKFFVASLTVPQDATNPWPSMALRHRTLTSSIFTSLPRQLQIESHYPMTTTACGSPVHSYSNTWDLAFRWILEEPTTLSGTADKSLASVVFGQEQQKLGAELYHSTKCTASFYSKTKKRMDSHPCSHIKRLRIGYIHSAATPTSYDLFLIMHHDCVLAACCVKDTFLHRFIEKKANYTF